jgi:hypothetical protein
MRQPERAMERAMKSKLAVATVSVGALLGPHAMAATLTAADQVYLDSIRPVSENRNAQLDQGTQAKIHAAIHDPATARDPGARRRAVAYLLDQYRNGWLWSLGRP